MKFLLVVALVALAIACPVRADEGLWTFDRVPIAKIRAAYGVDVTPAWLARVQAATVRLSSGCSGAVVSGQGLVITNQHCLEDCLQTLGGERRRDRRGAARGEVAP